jgi:L-arabinose isomerase
MVDKNRIPVVGVLLITTPRFRDLGQGTPGGVYRERKEREAERVVDALAAFSAPVFPGVVYTREDLSAAMRAFDEAKVDMVFACFLSWSDDFAWIRFLRDMRPMPVLFASIIRDSIGFEDSMNEDRFVEFLSAGALVGMLEASGSATRFSRPMMERAIGTLDEVAARCADFAKAAAARSVLRASTFGLLPSMNEVMWSTYVDAYDLFMKAGPEMRFLSVPALEKKIAGLPEGAAARATETILAAYAADATVDRVKMEASVAASLGLEALCRKAGVDVLVLNDIEPALMRSLGLRPGFTPCPGTTDVTVVPEGDIGGALAVFISKLIAGKSVFFAEPFHIDREKGVFAAGHAGPNDYTDPDGKTIVSRDERFARTEYKYAGAPFAWHTVSPGEKTMVHVSQCAGRFKLVCAVVDALPCHHHLAGYSHGLFRPRMDMTAFFQELMDIGVTQHYAIVAGDHRRALADFAKIMDFDFRQL